MRWWVTTKMHSHKILLFTLNTLSLLLSFSLYSTPLLFCFSFLILFAPHLSSFHFIRSHQLISILSNASRLTHIHTHFLFKYFAIPSNPPIGFSYFFSFFGIYTTFCLLVLIYYYFVLKIECDFCRNAESVNSAMIQ